MKGMAMEPNHHRKPRFQEQPKHQGLYLLPETVEEVDRPKPFIGPNGFRAMARHLQLFISEWLPLMLHRPTTRISVEMPADTKSFEHLQLVVRSDVLKFPEAERTAEKMLVRFALIDLTKPLLGEKRK
jgi:hypothetical protein